jgi:hypothetical protein
MQRGGILIIVDILECNGKYPVKVQAGYDYQLLKNVTV